jgi:hypothetical protein
MARRAQIARLTDELAGIHTTIAELAAALSDLSEDKERVAAEHDTVPLDNAVRDAHTVAAEQRRRRQELRDQHAGAVTACEQRQQEFDVARDKAEEFAHDVVCPPTRSSAPPRPRT